MELRPLRDYLLAKPAAVEELPFGPQVLVLKVCKRMFALIAWQENPLSLSLKAEPQHRITSYNVCYTKLLRRMQRMIASRSRRANRQAWVVETAFCFSSTSSLNASRWLNSNADSNCFCDGVKPGMSILSMI